MSHKIERTVCWFSCGAASAVATKLALAKYDNCVIVNQDLSGSEHPDHGRFLKECQDWYGQEIIQIKSDKYTDIWDVFKKTKWLVGVSGARCTTELKRKVAENFINHFKDREVFGYTIEEERRMIRFKEHNNERIISTPLIDEGLDKDDCLGILDRVGIKPSAMYEHFDNSNCIGCVKGGQKYWGKIRKHYPEVFDRMAKQERELDVAINKTYAGDGKRKKLFLDELPEDEFIIEPERKISCGLFCMAKSDELNNE